MSYVRRFKHLVSNDSNLRELDKLSNPVRTNTIHCLVTFSKFLGIHEDFKNRLRAYDIKPYRQNTYDSFIRILNSNNNSDVLEWFKDAYSKLDANDRLFLKYCLMTGLRRSECVLNFNKIIELSKANKLNDYYDSNLNCLLHFKYREFIRGTKNCLISFVKPELINQISNARPIRNRAFRHSLDDNNIKCRIKELRKFYATFMLQHGILEGETNMLQGRINSILFKNYFTPRLSELRDKVFKALNELEQSINN
jgi:intergrase/recombinase